MEIRRNAIIELINTHGTVKFSQIKKAFPNVSDMTLRTDLKALDDANQIIRIHGGAKSVQVVVGTDDFLNKRSFRNRKEKQMIAEKALSLLRPDTTIFLDSGSTATILASLFPRNIQLPDTDAKDFKALWIPTSSSLDKVFSFKHDGKIRK